MAISEHEVLTFLRVQSALEKIRSGMTVTSTGPLAGALGQLGCFPYVKVPCDSFDLDCELSIGGKPAGTFEKPDIDLILQESTASSFGKGQTTVLDPTYRHGKEIPSQKMAITTKQTYRCFSGTSEDEISAAMFVGKTVKLKFYKLAVYEEGGHFDWHMDSTHSDHHHATFLLALNTSWEGGDLKLRRNGVETLVDMHPKPDRDEGIILQGAAFYTDTEHKVEPVTKGIRIVLQYDVEVVGWAAEPALGVKGKDDNDDGDGDEVEEVEEVEEEDRVDLLDNVEDFSRKRRRYQESSGSPTADNAVVTKVTNIIAGLLADGEDEVAFAMQHLYRKSSILPEFLKGADAQLYRALVNSFDVTLRPVVLQSCSDYEGVPEECIAITWNQRETDPGTEGDANVESKSKPEDAESDAEYEAEPEDDEAGIGSKTTSKRKKVPFHLPLLSAIQQISYQSYIEHTGNEAQPEEKRYFGGGMFVRQKSVAKK
jgi:hypothetical protein